MTWEDIHNKGYSVQYDRDKRYTITEKYKQSTCLHCQTSGDLESKGFKTRKVTEIIEGELVEITIKKRKYLCHNCGNQFIPQDMFPPKRRYGPEYKQNVLRSMVEDINQTLERTAKQYGTCKANINKILEECREDFKGAIEQLEYADSIILYPYTYDEVKRCFIMGLDYDKKKTYLYMVLSQYDGADITRFLEKRSMLPFDQDAYEAIYLDLNKSVYCALEEHVGEDPLVIPKEMIEKFADNVRPHVERFDEPISLLDDFDIITNKEMSYDDRVKKWKKWCSDAARSSHELMQKFSDTMSTCVQACAMGVKMETKNRFISPEIEQLMSIVDRFQKCHCSFEMMAFRLIFTNPSALGLLPDGKEGRIRISTFAPEEAYFGFAIDIAELVEILNRRYPEA